MSKTKEEQHPYPLDSLVETIESGNWGSYPRAYNGPSDVPHKHVNIKCGVKGILVLEHIEVPIGMDKEKFPSEYKVLYKDKVIWICSSNLRLMEDWA